MLIPEGLWFLGECLEEASRTEDNNSTTPSINGYTLFRASTWCAQCYSRMAEGGSTDHYRGFHFECEQLHYIQFWCDS